MSLCQVICTFDMLISPFVGSPAIFTISSTFAFLAIDRHVVCFANAVKIEISKSQSHSEPSKSCQVEATRCLSSPTLDKTLHSSVDPSLSHFRL